MLNTTDRQAEVHYGDGRFDVIQPGGHVICAVTGKQIPLSRLKYWSVERQEPYTDAAAGLQRELEVRSRK